MTEDRYEQINFTIKQRADGQSWFDILEEVISKDCTDPDNCTCGLESGGGSSGTLDQIFEREFSVGLGIPYLMVAKAIVELENRDALTEDTLKVIEWAHKEIEFEAAFEPGGKYCGEENEED